MSAMSIVESSINSMEVTQEQARTMANVVDYIYQGWVHFDTNASHVKSYSNVYTPEFGGSLHITCLPAKYSNTETVKELVEQVIPIGKVNNIRIVKKSDSKNNRTFQSAFIDFEHWYISESTRSLLMELFNVTRFENGEPTYTQSIQVFGYEHFFWDDSETMKMKCLSVRFVKKGMATQENVAKSAQKLELSSEQWNSLYIPCLPKEILFDTDKGTSYINENSLQYFIEKNLQLGKIKRIDFVDREVVENEHTITVKAAFIHFEYWHDNNNAKFLRNKLDTEGQFRQKGYYNGKNMMWFYSEENSVKTPRYFVFKINYKPIPEAETELNIHQLVAANKKLEEILLEKDELVKKLMDELDMLKQNFGIEDDSKGPMTIDELATDGQEVEIEFDDEEDEDDNDTVDSRYNELSGQQLRDIWSELMGKPSGLKSSGSFNSKSKLIAEILRLKEEKTIEELNSIKQN
jgi:hypothetical protein